MITNAVDSAAVASPHQQRDWESLERQDWHLWMLAVLLMFVLGVSLLSFMFPSAFWFRDDLALKAPQRAFFGFCLLLALAVVYMLQRQATIRRLKRRLFQAHALALAAEQKAALQSYFSLPGREQLRDSLAMEFLRASRSGENLAVILLDVVNVAREHLGPLTALLRDSLRHGEALFRVSDTKFAILLPGLRPTAANAFARRMEEHIGNVWPELRTRSLVTLYPQEVASLTEMESALRGDLETAA